MTKRNHNINIDHLLFKVNKNCQGKYCTLLSPCLSYHGRPLVCRRSLHSSPVWAWVTVVQMSAGYSGSPETLTLPSDDNRYAIQY